MNLNDPKRVYVVAGVALVIVGMWGGSSYLRDRLSQADGQVKELKHQAALFQEQAIQKNKELDAANFRYDALKRTSDAKVLAAQQVPVPEAILPVPETVEGLTVAVRTLLSPTALVVKDPNQSTILNQSDGEKVFIAFNEAMRIPGFEAKVNAQEGAIVSLEATVKAAGDRFGLQSEALSLAGTQLEISQKQTQILTKEVGQAKRKGFLDKILWGAAGLGVGVLAGKH